MMLESVLGEWIRPALLLVSGLILGWAAERWGLKRLKRLFEKTPTRLDDAIAESLEGFLSCFGGLAGLMAAAQASPLSAGHRLWIVKGAAAAVLLLLTWSAVRLTTRVARLWSEGTNVPLSLSTLAGRLGSLAVLTVGALLILSNLGVSITPLLTALGVGSLAVALALQDTLGNFFAGLYIIAGRQVEPGDYVKLDSGQEGFVEEVGWRLTKIKELPGNIIQVANGKLAQAIVTNYHKPDPSLAVLVQMGVSYGSDLARVEAVTVDVAREVQRTVPGGVADFEPFIRYHTFGDSAVQFTVILRARMFTDRFLVTHEFIKRVRERYRREGIEIPFPQRVVHMEKPSVQEV